MHIGRFSFLLVAALSASPLLTRAAAADPWDEMFEQPLVKWALFIGDAKSLPWGDPASWDAPASGYSISQVPEDTQALLAPETPILARMETMRRAIAYSRRDPGIAYQVLGALVNRAGDADAAGKPDLLALFDLGYFFEACRQAKWLKTEYLGDRNGYSLVIRAIQLAGNADPRFLEMQFAAGLILLEPKGQHPYYPHFKTVVKQVKEGTLLEKNLVTHLKDKFEADSLPTMRASKYLLR